MSQNEHKGDRGRMVTFTAPTGGVSSGDLVTLATGSTGWVGEAVNDIAAGDDGAVETGHQSCIPKNTGTGESFDVGDSVYKDADTGKATATASGNDYIGRASVAVSTTDATVWTMFAPAGG